MTRLVTFADGFTAASPPDVTPGAQENYNILNNQAVAVALVNDDAEQVTFDPTKTKSVFVDYELERLDDDETYRQQGSLMLINTLTGWEIQYGNYVGDDLLQEAMISAVSHVVLDIDSVTGAMTYLSGEMLGTGYEGTFKTIITRILV